MFRPFTRLPLRRCLHTARPRSQTPSRLGLALGVSSAAAAYATWRLTSDGQRIKLDAEGATSMKQVPSSSKLKAEPHAEPSSSSATHSKLLEPTFSSDDSSLLSSSPSSPDSQKPTPPDGSEEEPEDAESGTGGAYDPVTGKINWDCPCLGGMAHGPCGPEFREAFSCFIYSEQEPKGIDCVEKFRGMQDCFRRHPEVYGDEIMDDEEEEAAGGGGSSSDAVATSPSPVEESVSSS